MYIGPCDILTSVLQERTDDGKVEVIACYYHGQSETKTITDELKGNVIDVRSVAWQENDGLFLLGGFCCDCSEPEDLLTRHMNTCLISMVLW